MTPRQGLGLGDLFWAFCVGVFFTVMVGEMTINGDYGLRAGTVLLAQAAFFGALAACGAAVGVVRFLRAHLRWEE